MKVKEWELWTLFYIQLIAYELQEKSGRTKEEKGRRQIAETNVAEAAAIVDYIGKSIGGETAEAGIKRLAEGPLKTGKSSIIKCW